METEHCVFVGDSREMNQLDDDSVELIVTSPPYPMIEMWDELFTEFTPDIEGELDRGEGQNAFELIGWTVTLSESPPRTSQPLVINFPPTYSSISFRNSSTSFANVNNIPITTVRPTSAGFNTPPAIEYSHAPSYNRSNHCRASYGSARRYGCQSSFHCRTASRCVGLALTISDTEPAAKIVVCRLHGGTESNYCNLTPRRPGPPIVRQRPNSAPTDPPADDSPPTLT